MYLVKAKNGAYSPCDNSDFELSKYIGVGSVVKVSAPRNYRFLKKAMALLNLGFNNQSEFTNFDSYRKMKIINAGLVVFDPPHMKSLGKTSWMAKKYGVLKPTWQRDIKAGFDECMRVLRPEGILIFKWNEKEVKLTEVLKAINIKPLFGHVTGKHGRTIWLCFMKPS